MTDEYLTLEAIDEFLRKNKRRGASVISAMGKQKAYIEALKSPIGNTLLSGLIARQDSLLEKIIQEEADVKDLAEYRVLRSISSEWAEKIAAYVNNVNSIVKETGNE